MILGTINKTSQVVATNGANIINITKVKLKKIKLDLLLHRFKQSIRHKGILNFKPKYIFFRLHSVVL